MKYFLLIFISLPLYSCQSPGQQNATYSMEQEEPLATYEKLSVLVSIRTGRLKIGGNFYLCPNFIQNHPVSYILRHHKVDPFLKDFLNTQAVPESTAISLRKKFAAEQHNMSQQEAEEKYLIVTTQSTKHFSCAGHIEACMRALISKKNKEAEENLEILKDCFKKNRCISKNVSIPANAQAIQTTTKVKTNNSCCIVT